jgi:hypothetical protein
VYSAWVWCWTMITQTANSIGNVVCCHSPVTQTLDAPIALAVTRLTRPIGPEITDFKY